MIKIDLKEILIQYGFVVLIIILSNFIFDNKFFWSAFSALVSIIPIAYYYTINVFNFKLDLEEESTEENTNISNIKYPVIVYDTQYVNGFLKVFKLDKDNILRINYLNKDGKYISNVWYNEGTDFNKFNLAIVKYVDHDTSYFIINENGELHINNSFYNIEEFSDDGLCKVYWKDGTINFVDINGKFLFKDWKHESNVKFTYE